MEENLFKDAKFGDRFVCENGKIAIYQYDYDCFYSTEKHHRLFTDKHILDVPSNGKISYDEKEIEELIDDGEDIEEKYSGGYDIVSKYKDPINEEELDKLAKERYPVTDEWIDYQYGCEDTNSPLRKAFKIGFLCREKSKYV